MGTEMSELVEVHAPRDLNQEAIPHGVHHWMLSDSVTGTIPGQCTRCGAERGFSRPPG